MRGKSCQEMLICDLDHIFYFPWSEPHEGVVWRLVCTYGDTTQAGLGAPIDLEGISYLVSMINRQPAERISALNYDCRVTEVWVRVLKTLSVALRCLKRGLWGVLSQCVWEIDCQFEKTTLCDGLYKHQD
jgi:hypothetical protein